MGQQESTYKKLDEKARRRRREKNDKKEARKEQEEKVTSTTSSSSLLTEKEKVKAGGPFSLASLRWRPSLMVGSSPTEADLSSWPGWYHGWCNKAQVSKLKNCFTNLAHSVRLSFPVFFYTSRNTITQQLNYAYCDILNITTV